MEEVLTKQATRYTQGTRTVYGFSLNFGEIEEYLPRRLPEDFAKLLETNRPIDPKRATLITEYISEQENWVLQPITLATNEELAEYDEKNGMLTVKEGAGEPDRFRIIDGQHRRQAIHQLLEKDRTASADNRSGWETQEMGITLYVENTPKKLRQMFADIAETKPIDRATKVRFNTGDPFNNISLSVETESQLLKDRINTARPTTQIGKDTTILTSMELKDIVSIIATGRLQGKPGKQMCMEFAAPNKENEVMEETLTFLDEFLPKVHTDFNSIVQSELSSTEISLRRQDNLALYPIVMTFLARCFHHAQDDDSREKLATHLSKQNWQRDTHVRENGEGLLRLLELVEKEKTSAAKVAFLRKGHPEWDIAAAPTARQG